MERHLLYLQLNFHLGITAGKMRKEKKQGKHFNEEEKEEMD